MCHSISSESTVITKDGAFIVNDQAYPSEDMAMQAVFGGHYARFLDDFFRQTLHDPPESLELNLLTIN